MDKLLLFFWPNFWCRKNGNRLADTPEILKNLLTKDSKAHAVRMVKTNEAHFLCGG